MSQTAQATRMLRNLGNGDADAAEDLLPLVYEQLRTLAAGYMQRERADHTLSPTALVHEAYVRMIDQSEVNWKGRAHFFAVAAQMIRRILVDHARKKKAAKRGGDVARVELSGAGAELNQTPRIDVLALEEALEELDALNERHRRIVELRYFVGLSVAETSHVLGVSEDTVKRDWRMARAWLAGRLDSRG